VQVGISIEPYLVVEKAKLIQYIEHIIQVSQKLGQNQVCLHFDYFKPNPEVFRLVQSYSKNIAIDLHLMHEPAPSLEGFRSVTFDAVDWRKKTLPNDLGSVEPSSRGLYIDLGNEISGYEDLICAAHYIIIMTVKCGKSGQSFQASALRLVSQIRQLNPNATIIIDGGVNETNIQLLKDAGVDVVVVGNYAKKCYESGTLLKGINRLLHV